MSSIKDKVSCDKTLTLINKSLVVGILGSESGKHIKSYPPAGEQEGTPQGSILSPLLSNIVLNNFDKYMDKTISKFETGTKRERNKEYDKITSKIQNLRKFQSGSPQIKDLAILRRSIPSLNMLDPNFKRMMYIRYADDFVVLIIGSHDEAKMIKHRITDAILKKCGLILNDEKTLITSIKDGFTFLGTRCIKTSALKAGLFRNTYGNPGRFRMRLRIEIPIKALLKKLESGKFLVMDRNNLPKATARKDMTNFSHHEIISFYQQRVLGLTAYYKFASNYTSLRKILMFLQISCALTLALKYKLRTSRKVFSRFGKHLQCPETETKLIIPNNLPVTHSFTGKSSPQNVEENLNQS